MGMLRKPKRSIIIEIWMVFKLISSGVKVEEDRDLEIDKGDVADLQGGIVEIDQGVRIDTVVGLTTQGLIEVTIEGEEMIVIAEIDVTVMTDVMEDVIMMIEVEEMIETEGI